jgi:hypothetical protein
MICTTGQPARRRRLVDARHDQRGRPLAEEDFQQAFLFHAGIVGVAHLDLEVGIAQPVIDAAHDVGEDVVGERRHQHADHIGARRGQRAGVAVGHIAERLHRRRDLPAQILRDQPRLAQRPRHGDGADAGKLCDVGDGRPAAAAPRPRFDLRAHAIEAYTKAAGRATGAASGAHAAIAFAYLPFKPALAANDFVVI